MIVYGFIDTEHIVLRYVCVYRNSLFNLNGSLWHPNILNAQLVANI